jgi:hypothetical protein
MKYFFTASTILCLLLVSTYALDVFREDFEDETPDFGGATAEVGRWDGSNVSVLDGYFAGIPDNPSGGFNVARVLRGVGSMAVAAYPATIGNFYTVHAEFDMLLDETASGFDNSTVFGMLHDLSAKDGRPDAGWFPHIDVRSTGMQAHWNDSGPWIVGTDLGPRPTPDVWHHYEFDYTVGVTTSLVMSIDGVPTTIPPPWGWDALGQDVDDPPGSRNAAVQMVGLSWYANDNSSVAWIDDVLITFENGQTQFVANANAVLQDDTRAIGFESEAGILYKLESTTDVVNGVWTAANWTLTGTGGMLYVFDSNPTSATTEEYYRLVK